MLVLIIAISFPGSAFAAAGLTDQPEIGNIVLMDIDPSELPDGVVPFNFDCEEDAIEFVREAHSQIQKQLEIPSETIIRKPEITTRGIRWDFVTDYKPLGFNLNNPKTGEKLFASCKFNVFSEFQVDYDHTAGIIKAYRDPGVSLTGITAGTSLVNGRCIITLNSSTKATLSGRGTLEYYLLVNSFLKLAQEDIRYDHIFKTSQ